MIIRYQFPLCKTIQKRSLRKSNTNQNKIWYGECTEYQNKSKPEKHIIYESLINRIQHLSSIP